MNQSSQRITIGPGQHPPASILLAMDTSTRTVGLALYNGVQVLGELVWTSLHCHTVELAPAVSDMLIRAKIKINELGVILRMTQLAVSTKAELFRHVVLNYYGKARASSIKLWDAVGCYTLATL